MPSDELAKQLIDILWMFITSDDDVSEEENLIFQEVTTLVNNYISAQGNTSEAFLVVLIPQDQEQQEAMQVALPAIYLTGECICFD